MGVKTIDATAKERLRTAVKRLVIELGYLEKHVAELPPHSFAALAARSLDVAIDMLNHYLAEKPAKS